MFNFGVHGAVVHSLPLGLSESLLVPKGNTFHLNPTSKKRTPSWVRNKVDSQHSLPLLESQQQVAMRIGCIRRLQDRLWTVWYPWDQNSSRVKMRVHILYFR